jgi:hypothetical protein
MDWKCSEEIDWNRKEREWSKCTLYAALFYNTVSTEGRYFRMSARRFFREL